jgi:hypothetical protein
MLVETSPSSEPVEYAWYHGVEITIGVGPNRAVAAAIFNSIGYTPGLPDTPAIGVCGRNPDPQQMPTPERLAKALRLEHGNVVLAPPAPADKPTVDPASVWKDSGSNEWFETYRLILARYTSLFPARPGPQGHVPENQNVLAWIVYSSPVSPTIEGCGMWGADVTNARTGAAIGSIGWAPGP